MEIKASDLRNGVEVDSGKYTILYKHNDSRPFWICDYATKDAQYKYVTLSQAVRTLNELTGYNDVAVED